jgi:hypothetical protein
VEATIVFVISSRRIAGAILALAVIVAGVATSRTSALTGGRGHETHRCQAAAPAGRAATIEAADVGGAVHHAASAPGISGRSSKLSVPPPDDVPAHDAFAFARPHDPRHLHAFSLLI